MTNYTMRLSIALGLLAAAAFAAGAQEPDYLRLGMRPDEAAAVYTALRSCSNAPFTAEAGRMGWEAPLYGGSAAVEIRFGPDGADRVSYRIRPNGDADPAASLAAALADRERAHGAPSSREGGGAAWSLPEGRLEIRLGDGELVVELVSRALSGG